MYLENLPLSFLNVQPLHLTLLLCNHEKNVHKIARQETEGFTRLIKTYLSSVKDADLNEEEILDSLNFYPGIYTDSGKVWYDIFLQPLN